MYTAAEYLVCVVVVLAVGMVLFVASLLAIVIRETARLASEFAHQVANHLAHLARSSAAIQSVKTSIAHHF